MGRVEDSAGREAGRTALVSAAFEVTARALAVILSIAIARVLEPTEVGVLGLAVIFVGVASQVAYCAETASVSGESLGGDNQYALAAVGIRFLITAALVVGMLFALPRVTSLLAGTEEVGGELTFLVHLLSWQLLLELVGTYPRVLLQRQLRLTWVAVGTQLAVLVHVGLSVLLLTAGYGAPGVVWACLTSVGVNSVYLWLRVLGRYPLAWEGRATARLWREAIGSTGKVFVGGILGYVNGRVDNLLVAGVLGPAAMSFYSMAWSVSRIPAGILSQVLSFTLIPTLARVQEDRESIAKILQGALGYSYIILAPVCAGLFVSAPSVVNCVLGTKWLPLVPCLRMMSITVLMGPLVFSTSALLIGTGRAHVPSLATVGQFLILYALIVPLSLRWNITGAALGDLAGVAVLTVILYVSARLATRDYRPLFVSAIRLPLLAAVCAGSLAAYVGSYLDYGKLRAASEICVLVGGYALFVWLGGGREKLASMSRLAKDAIQDCWGFRYASRWSRSEE